MQTRDRESFKQPEDAEEADRKSPRGQTMSRDTSRVLTTDNSTFLSKMGETLNSMFSTTPTRGSDQSRLDSSDISNSSLIQGSTMKKYNSGDATNLIPQNEDLPINTRSGIQEDGQRVRNLTISAPVLQTTRSPTPNIMSMGRSGSVSQSQLINSTLRRDSLDDIQVTQEELNENNMWNATHPGEKAAPQQQPQNPNNQERLHQVKGQLLHLLQKQNDMMFKGDTTAEDINQMTELIRRARIAKKNLEEMLTLENDGVIQQSKTISPQRPTPTKSGKVPNNMPKFRQNGPYKEPSEFLEAFNTVMEAHNIPEECYGFLIKLCLEQVDARWLDMMPALTKTNWRSLQHAFIQHFQHPQAHNMYMDQIRKLRMEDLGVQRYTDQFIHLANLIGWTLNSSTAIHQYKEGLPQWIMYHLISIESGSIIGEQLPPDVTMLGQAALSIESDLKSRDNSSHFITSKTSNKLSIKCNYCHNLGHIEVDCRRKKSDNDTASTEKKPNYSTTICLENTKRRKRCQDLMARPLHRRTNQQNHASVQSVVKKAMDHGNVLTRKWHKWLKSWRKWKHRTLR